jgi:prepilin-type N-terminal cleavage/methylation domain-containing protein
VQDGRPGADPTHVRGVSARNAGGERGFTLVEVMVTMVLLAGGLFAVLGLVDRGNLQTGTTMRREAATNLARELVERSHALPYASLGGTGTAAALRTAVDPSGTRASTMLANGDWTIRGRATTARFTVHVDSCAIAVGSSSIVVTDGTTTYCNQAGGGGGGGGGTTQTGQSGACKVQASTDPVIGVQIKLLVDVSLCVNGALAKAVCNILGNVGPLNAILNPLVGKDGAVNVLLNGLAGASAQIDLCNGSPVNVDDTSRVTTDSAKKVAVTVSWGSGQFDHVRQTTVVGRPGGSST